MAYEDDDVAPMSYGGARKAPRMPGNNIMDQIGLLDPEMRRRAMTPRNPSAVPSAPSAPQAPRAPGSSLGPGAGGQGGWHPDSTLGKLFDHPAVQRVMMEAPQMADDFRKENGLDGQGEDSGPTHHQPADEDVFGRPLSGEAPAIDVPSRDVAPPTPMAGYVPQLTAGVPSAPVPTAPPVIHAGAMDAYGNLLPTTLEQSTLEKWRGEGITPTARGMLKPEDRGPTQASITERRRQFELAQKGEDAASGRRINEMRTGGEIQGGLEAQRGRIEQGRPKAVAFGGGAGVVITKDGAQVVQPDNFSAYEKGVKDAKQKGATVHPTNNGAWIVEGDNPPVFVENPNVTKDKQGKTTEKYIGEQFVIKDKEGNPTLRLVWNAKTQTYDRKPVTLMDKVDGLPDWPGATPQGEAGGGAGGAGGSVNWRNLPK